MVTDAGVEALKGCRQLRKLELTATMVSDEGVQELRSALPECEVLCER